MHMQANNFKDFIPTIGIRGKALYRKVDKLFPLIHDMASSTDFTDRERLKEVLLKHYTGLQSALGQNAIQYAMNLSASGLDVAGKINNDWYGLNYYWAIKEIAKEIDKELDSLIHKLQGLQKQLLCLENPHLVVTCDEKMYEELRERGFYGLQDIVTGPGKAWKGNYPLPIVEPQARVIASAVAFTSQVFKTVPYTHPDSPALGLAASLFEKLTLHKEIREQGGAYGSGATNNSLNGSFSFYGYRDPNIYSTINAFKNAVQGIVDGKFDEEDLIEAKLDMIQSMDSPVAPGSRAALAYGWLQEGRTPAVRQAFRERLLAATAEDVIRATKAHLVAGNAQSTIVSFAGQELIEKENKLLKASKQGTLTIKSIDG